MDFTCANCKYRSSWDCEDYHWGYWDTPKCSDNFELDINTLSDEDKESIFKLRDAIVKLAAAFHYE